MDSQFLEFYGKALLNAAEGQRQFEKFSEFLNKGLKGFDQMEALFKSCYGIPNVKNSSDSENEKINSAIDAFQSSFSTYVKAMGWVPAADHEALKKKCETLENEIKNQQVLIEQLNMLLKVKNDTGVNEFFDQIQLLSEKQNVLFKEFMQTFDTADTQKD